MSFQFKGTHPWPAWNSPHAVPQFNFSSLHTQLPNFDGKKFVIKQTFKDFKNTLKPNTSIASDAETHFNVPWNIRLHRDDRFLNVYLDCAKNTSCSSDSWSIDVKVNGKVIYGGGTEKCFLENKCHFAPKIMASMYYCNMEWATIQTGSSADFQVELTVRIEKLDGIRKPELRNFDDDEAKECSDVTLVVGTKKFYVLKMYLAAHSSYFKALFSTNYSEAGKSELELKDIDPNEMQSFLELIYGEPVVDDDTVDGILKLADMYDSKTAIRQCEKFLLTESKQSLKAKFTAATQYPLEQLLTKCMGEIKKLEDFKAVTPEEGVQYSHDVWKELYKKLLALKI